MDEKNIASVIAMLHQRIKLWMPNYVPFEEIRQIKDSVGSALDANARRNEELISLRHRVAELERLLKLVSGPMSYGHWSTDFRNEVDKAIYFVRESL